MPKSQKEVSEQKTAAASYVLQFYGEVIQLTNNYANYRNMLLEFKTKVGGDSSAGLNPEEKTAVINLCHTVRFYATKTYVGYTSINAGLKVTGKKEIEEQYNIIKEQFIIGLDNLDKYVSGLNAFLLTEVVKNLLQSSEELINKLYNEKEEAPENVEH